MPTEWHGPGDGAGRGDADRCEAYRRDARWRDAFQRNAYQCNACWRDAEISGVGANAGQELDPGSLPTGPSPGA